MATAVTGGIVALAAPATADTATGARPGHQVATAAMPGGDLGGDHGKGDGKGDGKGGGKKDDCPAGPPGPPGPRGRVDGVDAVFATPTGGVPGRYVAETQANGTTLIRDPSSVAPNRPWTDISTVAGYPGQATGVTLAVSPAAPNVLHITVRTITGIVAATTCTLTVNPAWPTNCAAFTQITPPL